MLTTGQITAWIAENLAVESSLVCGIDLAEVQIEHARAAYAASGIQFEVMDAQEVSSILRRIPPATGDMKDNLFDLCVSFTTLHWVYDVPRVFREVSTLLRPGGTSPSTSWEVLGRPLVLVNPSCAALRLRNSLLVHPSLLNSSPADCCLRQFPCTNGLARDEGVLRRS